MRHNHLMLVHALRAAYPAYSHDELTAFIVCRRVLVDGEVVTDPKRSVARTATLTITLEQPYVSRGGEKLASALSAFAVPVESLIFLDAGASTGGFTDCLLRHGAHQVHAVDVGYNQLDYRLRSDERVVVHERTNIMHLSELDPQPDAAVCDLSFRSIRKAASHILSLCKSGAYLIALIKPQFEISQEEPTFDGVIRDEALLKEVLEAVLTDLITEGLGVHDLMESPITGAKGNTEYLVLLREEAGLSVAQALTRLGR
ncbi:MAG TPA: TlyA family RNA methyltransferase [Sphaerochaeta sp.]|nr:TlyA family RNA methyltransferase [Sphaerochaeta sp.]